MKVWEIWSEGHNDMGNIAPPHLVGTAEAETFDEAVVKLGAEHMAKWGTDREPFRFNGEYWEHSYWFSRLHDSEAAARKDSRWTAKAVDAHDREYGLGKYAKRARGARQ